MNSQTQATTTDGKKVILDKNGTWMYAEADCGALIKSGTYAGGKTMLLSKEDIIVSPDNGATGVKISLTRGTNLLLVNIINLVPKLKCVAEKAPITLEFVDGTKMVTQHAANSNCTADFSLTLGKTKDDIKLLDILKSKKIRKITIGYTTSESKEYTEEFIFTNVQAEKFSKTIQCLFNS